jgi:superfamily I DNA and/or RNA helicase
MRHVDDLIIDEASACTEAEILIPLGANPKRMLLIGDPKQLPATVMSKEATGSTFNEQEVDAVVKLVLDFQTRHQVSNDWLASPDHLRIITFYKAQEDTLRFKLDQYHLNVTLSTVDAAQGCEADIVILSFVRGTSAFTGFIKDMQRLNVALTRARFQLVCVGNLKAIADLRKVGGNYELIEMARDALDRSHIVDHPGPLPPPPPVNAAKKRAARGPNSKRSSFTDGRDALKERKKRRRERGKFKDGEETTSKLQI